LRKFVEEDEDVEMGMFRSDFDRCGLE